MLTILLSSLHRREGQIIQTAFEQFGFDIVDVRLTSENFLKYLKIAPNVFLIDIPKKCENEIKLIQSLRKQPSNKNPIILGYGPENIAQLTNAFKEDLFDYYFPRPLKFSVMLKEIKNLLPAEVQMIEANVQAIHEQSDVAIIRDSSILPSTKLSMIVHHASQFLAFPFTLPKILSITNDPGSGAPELAKMIETDPVVSARVLKTANTIFYSARDHRITKMRDAIVRIGFTETKRVILCIEVMKLFEDKQRNFGFDRKLFWLHSMAVAIATEFFFSKGEYKRMAEHAFLAGLLHDLGTIVLDEFLPEIFCEALEKTVSVSGEFSTIFCEEYAFYPYMIAQAFMEEWNFHQTIKEGIFYRGAIIKKDNNLSTEGYLQKALFLAHMFVKSHLLGRPCDQVIHEVPSKILVDLGFKTGITPQIVDQIYFKIVELCRFVDIDPSSIKSPYATMHSSSIGPLIYYYSSPEELFSPHYHHLITYDFDLRKVSALSTLQSQDSEIKLLIISLDDSSEENIADFFKSEDFQNCNFKNCLIITSKVEFTIRQINTPNISVIPRDIDARLFGRLINAYVRR